MNLLKQDSGSISLFGLTHERDERAIKERIGFVYDENIFYEELTLKDMKKIIGPAYKNGMMQYSINMLICLNCR